MTNKKMLLAIAGAAACVMPVVATAQSVTYTGSQRIGQISASYSITTDGTLGEIGTDHLTAFDVSLSEGGRSPVLFSRTADGGTGSWNGFVVASETSLTIAPFDALSLDTDATNSAGGPSSFLTFRANATLAQLTDDAYPAGLSQTASMSNDTTPFATVAAAAVPEPAMWATMVLGLGAVGFAMRRRQRVTTRIAYAA